MTSLEMEQLNEILELRAALENIANRSKNTTETYYIWKVTQEALNG